MRTLATIAIVLLPSLALAQPCRNPAAQWLLPTRLLGVGLVLRAPRRRAGRDPVAA